MENLLLSRLWSGVGQFCIAAFVEARSNGSHCARSRQGAAASTVPPLGHLYPQLCPRTQSHNLPPLLAIASILEFVGHCSRRRPAGTTFKRLKSTSSQKGAFTWAMSLQSHRAFQDLATENRDVKRSLSIPAKKNTNKHFFVVFRWYLVDLN